MEMAASAKEKKQIFILSGQSNMAGRGGVSHKKWDGFLPPQCLPHPAIHRFSAHSHWEEAREPLHADIDTSKTCGVGPGMAFARALLHSDPTVGSMGLVPCAVGGTAIREWEPGTHLYTNMVRRAEECVRESGGEIRALLWYQGESDTLSRHDAQCYKANMEKLIRHVRDHLRSPSLPFIQVALASGDTHSIDMVREAQLGINLPNVVCVDAKGLPLNEDNLHLTTEAQVELGNMLADAYLKNFTACL
ncbi:putative carbohydrate esterase [Cinnamomum micranthum f. kanehirae]|uniref:Putative carbohydrate esterase n=1 Tax=Cinnamomum micranthum f. kanehirae TaxID=337451 RepID=A0A443NSF0_9MAGN|nr:putative carbohydrate esterase [Cinnamomum micranthum f. kanehirae]